MSATDRLVHGRTALRASLIAGAALAMAGCATLHPKPAGPPPRVTLSLDTPVQAIVAAPGGKAVLDKDLPGLTTNAQYGLFKTMTLNQLQPLSGGKLTKAKLAKVGADLAALNAAPTPAAR